MGYTHYWTQTRSFTSDEWSEVSEDVRAILAYTEYTAGVPLANGLGDGGTRPAFDDSDIRFNGIGDDGHETFTIHRKRTKEWDGGTLGADFCKTARKPYDIAVTACLCYLSTVTETHTVSSDGHGHNFLAGLDLARAALPRKANTLDIPMDVMREDRWTGPWVSGTPASFDVHFCVNGKGYVEKTATHEWHYFPTHKNLGEFLDANKQATFRKGGNTGWGGYDRIEPNIWNASGSFDKARHGRIAKAQAKVLASLFPAGPDHNTPPPAYARPDDMLRPEDAGTFCYSLEDLLRKVAA